MTLFQKVVPPLPSSALRVLHGPANVGNQPWSLSRAERALGMKSDVVVNYGTSFAYPADVTLGAYGDRSPTNAARRKIFAMTAPLRYDVLHYYFGRSFMSGDDWGKTLGTSPRRDRLLTLDARLARKMGRRTIMTLQGCDVRIAEDSSQSNNWTPCGEGLCAAYTTCVKTLDQERRSMIEALLPLMDRVFYLNPELGRWVPNGTFLPYANVQIDQITPVPPSASKKLRIVHAPSDPKIKGTPRILAALDALKQRFDFELILVQGKTHAEAIEMYRSADLAIDQILAGWYGGFAVELMAMGKPVAAYIRDADRRYAPDALWDDMAILRVAPGTLEEDLAQILANAAELPALGRKARAYVERWHDPHRIAIALSAIYQDPTAPLVL